MVTIWWRVIKCSTATELPCDTRSHPLPAHVHHACPAVNQAHLPGAPAQIGHLTREKTGHSSDHKIPQMPDALGELLLYDEHSIESDRH